MYDQVKEALKDHFTVEFWGIEPNPAIETLRKAIALQSAIQIGVSPVPFLFAVTVGASMCFASPFSTPPNALVMPAGQ